MKQKHFVLLITLLLLVICFIPVLHTSLYSDDIANFQSANAYADKSQLSIWHTFKTDFYAILNSGRFTPATIMLQSWAFIQFDTVGTYKQYQFIIGCLGAATFVYYLYSLNIGINIALWAVFLLATVQYRALYHDPSISLHGMYPLIAIVTFLSLGFYAYYIRTNRCFYYGLSLLFYVLAHLSSEVGLVTTPLLVLTAWVLRMPLQRFIKTCWPFLLVTIAYLCFIMWLRSQANDNVYEGLKANAEPIAMWNVFIKQVYGSLPLSSLHRQKSIPTIILHQLKNVEVLICTVVAVVMSIIVYFTTAIGKKESRINKRFFMLAIAIIAGPAIFITPSVKYQQELKWGMAYLPVFLQYFGVAAFLAYLCQWLTTTNNNFAKISGGVMLLGGTCCIVMGLSFNSAVINKASYDRGKPAEAMMASVNVGILNPCEETSSIILTRDFIWRAPDAYSKMFYNTTGKKFEVQDLEFWSPSKDTSFNVTCYELDCVPGSPIVTTLYERNCSNGERLKLLKRHIIPCDIELIEEEKQIHYYSFD